MSPASVAVAFAFTFDAWGLPVNVLALAYGVAAIVSLMWPRTPGTPWRRSLLSRCSTDFGFRSHDAR